jgi:uncharacterized protein
LRASADSVSLLPSAFSMSGLSRSATRPFALDAPAAVRFLNNLAVRQRRQAIMSVEDNKKIVARFFEDLSAGNGAAVLGALADSATWWVAGNFPLSGTKTKAQFAELVGSLGNNIEGGLRVTPSGVTAEGDRVAVEAESYARMKNGKTYQNKYHFLLVIRDGKIQQVKEYLDTMHANDVLCS